MNDPSERYATPARALCLGISREWGPAEEVLEAFAETGWNGWFPVWNPGEDLRPAAARGAALGLAVQSVHAPWGKAAPPRVRAGVFANREATFRKGRIFPLAISR